MSLKEFCTILKQCADKLEEEIRYNLNDVHNIIYSNKLNETKMALEKAKDYHYKEIMDSIADILKNIKKILFHQDKIDWLGNEGNFTHDELRRFSYVKRQIYAFSNNEDAPSVPTLSVKREKRRSASEVSIGSLEAWEKYLDKKDVAEKEIEEKVAELKPLVPKRTLSNARRRKKFVSSTMGGFLEGDGRSTNLDSIFEDTSSTEDNERLSYSKSLDSLDQLALNEEQNIEYNETKTETDIGQNPSEDVQLHASIKQDPLMRSLESLHNLACGNVIANISENSKDLKENTVTTDDKEDDSLQMSRNETISSPIDSEIINIIKESTPVDENSIKNEIMDTFLNNTANENPEMSVEETNRETTKPKIVNVIFKKKKT